MTGEKAPLILDPTRLPAIEPLRRRSQALAMLDAILCPEWEYRYFSFNAQWSEGAQMGSMRNGSGDEYFILFDPAGAAIKGLAHETKIASDERLLPAIRTQVPAAFAPFLDEPAFSWDWVSFCYWHGATDAAWSRVVHPDAKLARADDGSVEFLWAVVGDAADYQAWAEEMYEMPVPLAAVEAVLAHTPLTRAFATTLNPEADWAQVKEDAQEIGYPF